MILDVTYGEKLIINYILEAILKRKKIKMSDVEDISITITKKNGSDKKIRRA